jgi:hypothetical protein
MIAPCMHRQFFQCFERESVNRILPYISGKAQHRLVFPFGRMHPAGSLALRKREHEPLLRRLSHGQNPCSLMNLT